MIHHRDPNVPQKLDAASVAEVERDPQMIAIYQQIDILNRKIGGNPHGHLELVAERAKMYNQAAKTRRAKKGEFIQNWWKESYDEYIAGNEFTERDSTDLFDIFRKYMPARDRLKANLFQEAPIQSEVGRRCLHDMLELIMSDERVAYYPGEFPVDGKCPLCLREMARCVMYGSSSVLRLIFSASIYNIAQDISYSAGENHSMLPHINRGIQTGKEHTDGSIILSLNGVTYVLSGSTRIPTGRHTVNPILTVYNHDVDFSPSVLAWLLLDSALFA
jgi:hypothetical protein